MKPSLELPPPGMSAFAFYKAQQKLARKKKPKKSKEVTKSPPTSSGSGGKKLLRSSHTNGKPAPMSVHDDVERVLSVESKVLRSGKFRKATGKVTKKAAMPVVAGKSKNKKNKKNRNRGGGGDVAGGMGVDSPDNDPQNKVAPAAPDGNIIASKGYQVRILGRQSPSCGDNEAAAAPARPSAGSGPPPYYNSVDEGRKLLAWLLEPEPLEEFLSARWLREPKVVTRNQPDWYQHLQLSSNSLDAMLRTNHLQYSKNVDVTSYENGVRETHNEVGRALPSQVWDYYNNGCSVRWLNPQAYSSRLWLLNSTLQEFFGGMVGANVYLTPPNSQGFAPHFDDIEAFVLQLEGKKHWRLYRPSEKDVNPRFSSRNFKPDEVGEPFMEVTLHAGDLLYFPRGIIHQASAADSHSLHVTISCYQHNTWADLLEQIVPAALSKAVAEDPTFREGLPLGHQDYVGSNCKEASGGRRVAFTEKVKNLVTRMLDFLPIDEGVDRMGKNFMAEALPPCLLSDEIQCSVYGSRVRILPGGRVAGASALQMMDENTKVKLVRRHCLRLVYELSGPQVYFTTDNTCECQEVEQQSLELTPDLVPGVAMLIYAYPKYLRVGELPIADADAKIAFTFNLWEKGLLLTKRPLTDSA